MPAISGLTHCPKLFAATGRSYGEYAIDGGLPVSWLASRFSR